MERRGIQLQFYVFILPLQTSPTKIPYITATIFSEFHRFHDVTLKNVQKPSLYDYSRKLRSDRMYFSREVATGKHGTQTRALVRGGMFFDIISCGFVQLTVGRGVVT